MLDSEAVKDSWTGEGSAVTGDICPERQLYRLLAGCMRRAERIDIIVSFLMESGVRLLMNELRDAVERGVPVRILTGNYLGITQPSALYLIKKETGSRTDLRFYNDPSRSFHPKSFIFHYSNYSDIFIGSSNISLSGLTSGIEWNYRFSSRKDPDSFKLFYETFEDLFRNHSIAVDDEVLKNYSTAWHSPAVMKELEKYDEGSDVHVLYEPRGVQIEALCALDSIRSEGTDKALVVAATGTGKTYLAAFDSKKYKRVLFVAHREEILKQAALSFKNVRMSDDYGFFNAEEKTSDRSVIFASVSTLGRKEYLNEKYFPADYFQYIVVDEFHHAVNDQYRRIISYFKPEFLLGLTATPERMDGKNIYELCDYNVAYEIGLKGAINRGMLVPFRYYGIYDDTDYSLLHPVHGRYDEKELNETYIGNVYRHDLIFKYYSRYGSERALGFCCSRAHAEEMAGEFCRRGIPAAAVYSSADGEFSQERSAAILGLKKGDIKVIFAVDMFNEGVDIPSVDMVMFLRPTESPVVFLQQLGRGLRKYRGKEYLTVLDFIGNYEKAGRVRFLLPGRENASDENFLHKKQELPDGCLVDFDMRLIDLFREMDRKHVKAGVLIRNEYLRVKDLTGRRPSRTDLFTYMDDDVYSFAVSHPKDSPFRNYLSFLNGMNELNEEEKILFTGMGRDFLNLLETTNMTKVYKMPVLSAFYNNGNIRLKVTEQDLLKSWKEFFDRNGNWKDLDKGITFEEYRKIKDREHIQKILKMPVHFLVESGKGFFVQEPGYALALCSELKEAVKNRAFASHMKDIIDCRTFDYYQRRYKGNRIQEGQSFAENEDFYQAEPELMKVAEKE